MGLIDKLRETQKLLVMSDAWEIANRAFVNNSFDGILTSLGMIVGSFLSGQNDVRIMILTGIGASVAMGVSGSFGAYMAESAVRKAEITEIEEKVMLKEFPDDTIFDKSAKYSSYLVAIVDGLSPFIASLLCFSPFIVGSVIGWDMNSSYLLSFLIIIISLFSLGSYLGKLSKERIWGYGIKMLLAGVVTGFLIIILGMMTPASIS